MKLPLRSIHPYQAMGERRSNPTHLAPSLFFSTPTSHKGDGNGLLTYRRISHERHTIRKASFEGKSWEIQYRLIDILIMNQDGQFHLRVEWDHLFWTGNDQTLFQSIGIRFAGVSSVICPCQVAWLFGQSHPMKAGGCMLERLQPERLKHHVKMFQSFGKPSSQAWPKKWRRNPKHWRLRDMSFHACHLENGIGHWTACLLGMLPLAPQIIDEFGQPLGIPVPDAELEFASIMLWPTRNNHAINSNPRMCFYFLHGEITPKITKKCCFKQSQCGRTSHNSPTSDGWAWWVAMTVRILVGTWHIHPQPDTTSIPLPHWLNQRHHHPMSQLITTLQEQLWKILLDQPPAILSLVLGPHLSTSMSTSGRNHRDVCWTARISLVNLACSRFMSTGTKGSCRSVKIECLSITISYLCRSTTFEVAGNRIWNIG